MADAAPYIREGQYSAYRSLNNVGYLCAYDQQVNWYHPQKKSVAGERAARWALSEFYEKLLPWEPALVLNYERKEKTIIISFDRKLKSSDDRPFEGFAIADSDRHFYPADADYYVIGTGRGGRPEYDETRIVVSHPLVDDPVAVRYAWARNPLGNMVDADSRIIPLPQFRTDDWDYPEAPYDQDGLIKHREQLGSLRNQAEEWAKERKIGEAEILLELLRE
jgi:sialate O-acetylesterase